MWETRCETIFEEQHCTERLDVWTMEVYQSGEFWCVTAWQVKAHGLVSLPLPNLAAESQQQAKANATRWLIEKLQGELDQLTTGEKANPAPPAVDNIPCGSCHEIQPINQLDPCHVCSEYTCSNCLAPMFDEVDQPAGHICNRCIERVAQRLGY